MPTLDRFSARIQKLPPYLRLRPGFAVVEEQPGQFLLHSGSQSFKITLPFPGISLPDFFNQLSGKRPLTDILEQLPPFHINFFLDVTETLHRSGLLVAGLNGANPRYIGTANMMDQLRQTMPGSSHTFLSEQSWQDRISQARIGLVGLGRIGSQLARLLAIVGVREIIGLDDGRVDESLRYTDAWYSVTDQGMGRAEALGRNVHSLNAETRFVSLSTSLDQLEEETFPDEFLQADIVVVATDQLRPQLYERINQACIQAQIPWTSYRPSWTGLTVEIGPTVLPRETACYECYQYRRRSNLAHPEQDDALAAALEKQSLPLVAIQLTPCLSLLCGEILRLLSGEIQPFSLGAVMEFDIAKAELARHPLLKVPRCPACRRDIQPFNPVRFWAELSMVEDL